MEHDVTPHFLWHAAASELCSPAAMATAAQTAAAAVGPARPPAAAEVASYSARLSLLRAALHAASDAALSTVPAAHDAHNGVQALQFCGLCCLSCQQQEGLRYQCNCQCLTATMMMLS